MLKSLTYFASLVVLLPLVGSADTSTQTPAASASQPNILWIITDDHRPDSIQAYNRATIGKSESELGYVLSPNIDKLVEEGVLYTRAFCNSPACGTSRTSMHTGRYPFRNGKYAWEATHQEMDFVRPAVSQQLKSVGYGTAVIGKRHYSIRERLDQKDQVAGNVSDGSDIFDFVIDFGRDLERNGIGDLSSTGAYGLIDAILYRRDAKETVYYQDGRVKEYTLSKADRELTLEERAIKEGVEEEFDILRAYTRINTGLILGGMNPQPAGETIDAKIVEAMQNYLQNADQNYQTLWGQKVAGPEADKPLFINLGFHLPHTPVLPPKKYRDMFMDRNYKLPAFDTEELGTFPDQLMGIFHECETNSMTDEEKLQAIRDYYAFTAYGDELIGDAVEAFKKYSKQQGRDYVIVFTVGDHGWHLGEQGIMAKFGPWKQSINGAAIVVSSKQDAFPAGSVVHDLVEYVDFAPTIMAAAGIEVNAPAYDYLDGVDLAEVNSNPEVKRDYILGEMNLVCGHRAYLRTDHFAFSMRTRDRRTVAEAPFLNDDILWALETNPKHVHMALYDLRVDPLERANVAATHEYQKLAEWFRQKLGTIVLGDGRIEADWSKQNSYSISNFAGGADDKKIDIPAELIPDPEVIKKQGTRVYNHW
ncbi:MAG: sulfatase-like hydrolase/transferase [Lentimonas sp.]